MGPNLSMSLARFSKECPGLAGSLVRLYGDDVARQIATDYCVAADLDANVELGMAREEGASFNPRVARLLSLFIQECKVVQPSMLRVVAYLGVPSERIDSVPPEVLADVIAVASASVASPEWVQGARLVLMLDTVRHLHMTTATPQEKERYLTEVSSSPVVQPGALSPEGLRVKLLHAVALQVRRLSGDVLR